MKFLTTKKDKKLIVKICERGWGEVSKFYTDFIDMMMDITAVHLNDCRLDLPKLLAADDFNFYHDIFGIAQYIDRTTGKLKDCFLPRSAKPHK